MFNINNNNNNYNDTNINYMSNSNNTISAINNNFNNITVTDGFNSNSSKDNLLNVTNKEENWRVGILCKKDCYYVILEILKCLERMGYEWKLVSSSYKIKTRKKNEDISSSGKSLNILIQVFGVSGVMIIIYYMLFCITY